MRKLLKVEKKKFFSYNYLNDKHKKIDWTIRLIFIVLLFIGNFINVTRDPLESIWFLETHVLLFVFIIASETTRAIMEKRFAENKNDYIFTTLQLVFMSISFLSLFTTNFFGWFR
ncbi:DUF4181 domain-containing protein [Bacillus sp. IB182487]|uniref:DUF4181 domain-containing protein n=2 Tax=Metabacillus arenae TaxID=2771434 RepID=A0A926S0R9_9BACI|nr:DUF4181 domain-containing protein [Metabacillus arenae]